MTPLSDFRARRAYFVLAASVFVADQASKIAAEAFLRERGPVTLIPGLFGLWHSRNRGGLFGLFAQMADPWRTALLTFLPLVAIGLIAILLVRTDVFDRVVLAGLGLILGGAAGNLLDRAVRGEVVDFLDAYVSSPRLASWLTERFGTAHWPTFNLADSAIVVGAGLLVLDTLRSRNVPAAAHDAP